LVVNDKQIWVFAGPNGSGKSTIIENYIRMGQCSENLICPDNLVRLEDRNNKDAYINAARKAEKRRFYEVAKGNSFSFETVLSKREKLDFICYAKSKGYFVHVIYVSTGDSKINIERVKMRVIQGGHDVPIDKIVSRYNRCMRLMLEVIHEAHHAVIYDNSGSQPDFIAEKINDVCYIKKNSPKWFERYIKNSIAEKKLIYDKKELFPIVYF